MVAQLWTISDVAEYLQVHENTVRKLIKKADLPHFRIECRSADIATAIRFEEIQIKHWLEGYKKGELCGVDFGKYLIEE